MLYIVGSDKWDTVGSSWMIDKLFMAMGILW